MTVVTQTEVEENALCNWYIEKMDSCKEFVQGEQEIVKFE